VSCVIGFDTSNYTTSLAFFDGETCRGARRLLAVPEGGLGLRQRDALFQHTKALPALAEELFDGFVHKTIAAVGASVTPRRAEGSYMPCFLAGETQGRVLAAALRVPFYPWSHQEGHIAAAAWSAGQMALLDKPHLAWHLSGGTTELLFVEPEGCGLGCAVIGGTRDLSAGQLIDRTGQRLSLPFPAGKAVDDLAGEGAEAQAFPVRVQDCAFSLSGLENQMAARVERGESPRAVCRFVLLSVLGAVEKATEQALGKYPGLPVLFAGGVASSRVLRAGLQTRAGRYFAPPEYATDNAVGTAVLTRRRWEGELGHG
jgi:N6-L-threonylcarbamoyladenine synthase